MTGELPSYLAQGEIARLFPVLSTTSKEGRTTSIVLACMSKVNEFGASLLNSLGQKVGARSDITTFTEVVLSARPSGLKDRPDGLIVLTKGKNEWKALVETKVGANVLSAEQVEKYRQLARDNGIDCVITISNQFAMSPTQHPLQEVQKSRSKIPVFHWSWMHILTEADLLLSQESVSDIDQRVLLNELRRFLSHESAGLKGFDRMPKSWTEVNRLVSGGGVLSPKSPEVAEVVSAWHQETRDLSLILSRMVETSVAEKIPKKHRASQFDREKSAIAKLCDENQLSSAFEIPDAAAQIDIRADLLRRAVDVSMSLRAPEDRVSAKARVNWLLRQMKVAPSDDLFIRLHWPGRAPPTMHLVSSLKEDPSLADEGQVGKAPHTLDVLFTRKLGARFAQQANFITDLEELVPTFYRDFGSQLSAWVKPAPKVKRDRETADEVAISALEEDARGFDASN